MITDKYNHSEVENRIYTYWEKYNLFKPKKNKKKFSIVIPPPNITGRLHMGHALNNSLQDVLVRFYRMKGLETLWQPGTDHAGIATQAVVEKKLIEILKHVDHGDNIDLKLPPKGSAELIDERRINEQIQQR